MKLFEKKIATQSLNIFEVSDAEKREYLNAIEVLFQNIIRQSMCWRVPKHWTNMQKRIFTQCFVKFNLGHAGKRCFYSYLKSQDCMLNHCLTMLAILTIITYNMTRNWNAFILKTKNFPEKFHFIFRIYMKFATFWTKSWAKSLSVFEIIHSKKRGYLNAYEVLFQNILRRWTY